jgi:hypothetical protein
MPAEKVTPDVCNQMDPLVALDCHENDMSGSYKYKISPLPEGDPDFRSHLSILGGMEFGGDS